MRTDRSFLILQNVNPVSSISLIEVFTISALLLDYVLHLVTRHVEGFTYSAFLGYLPRDVV